MSKIHIEDIQKEAQDIGWKLISDQYKNLDVEMEFECPEVHRVYLPYKKFRRAAECPICKSNPLATLEIKPLYKRPGAQRILALDQATITSGWAVYDDGKLIKYGSFTVKSASQDERRTEIKQWLASMINNWKPDLVALEDIQLQQFGAKDGDNIEGVTTFKTLAHLQGVLMNYLFENKIPYEIIHVSVWRKHCDIKGKSRSDKKKSAQLKVKEWYDVSVTTDEADAICIGKYAAETTIQKITMLSW